MFPSNKSVLINLIVIIAVITKIASSYNLKLSIMPVFTKVSRNDRAIESTLCKPNKCEKACNNLYPYNKFQLSLCTKIDEFCQCANARRVFINQTERYTTTSGEKIHLCDAHKCAKKCKSELYDFGICSDNFNKNRCFCFVASNYNTDYSTNGWYNYLQHEIIRRRLIILRLF